VAPILNIFVIVWRNNVPTGIPDTLFCEKDVSQTIFDILEFKVTRVNINMKLVWLE